MSAYENEHEYADGAEAQAHQDVLQLDELGVRDLLIALKRYELQRADLKEMRERIEQRYRSEEKRIDGRIESIRSSLLVWVQQRNEGNRVAFPDVGAVGLRKLPVRIVVKEAGDFERWAVDNGFQTTQVDTSGATEAALERFKETGELVPGVEVEAGEVGLQIRGA